MRPTFGYALYNRSLSYSAVKRHEDAIADITEAIRLNPANMVAFGGPKCDMFDHFYRNDAAMADMAEADGLDPASTSQLTCLLACLIDTHLINTQHHTRLRTCASCYASDQDDERRNACIGVRYTE